MKTSYVAPRKTLLVLFCLMFSAVLASAKNARIQQPIDESVRVVLQGNVRPLPKSATDLGPVSASLPAGRMLLVLQRSPQEDAELHQLLSDIQNDGSASYHKWLTPAQYAERFGVSAGDAQTLCNWLEGHGFTVNKVSAGRTSIEFSGTVGQLQSAFHTSIHRYAIGSQEHLANTNDPAIPAALAPVVSGIIGLNDFFPKFAQTATARASYDKQTHTTRPEFTTTAGGNLLYVGPADAATIYDTPNAFNANFKGSQSYTGNGVTIAVVSDANINVSDVANYRSFFGLPANTPNVIIDGNDPGVDAFTTGDTQKALRDVEIAGALAPNANVILYTARNTTSVPGIYLALARAVDDNLSDVIEFGFSSCEVDIGKTDNKFIEYEWEQAAVDGVTVVAAAGDSGPAACDLPANDASAAGGLAVNGYASTPYNVAVGGTDFDGLPGNFSGYVGSNGISLGYIPELPWNNSVAIGGNGDFAANTPYKDANGFTNDFAGGGGASSCGYYATGTSPCAAYPKPGWQTAASNLNIPQDGARDLPDVSLLAGTGQYGATWAVCGNDYDAAGNPVADCAPGSGSAATIQGLGGTSAAASAFAGIFALVGQSQGTRLGQANYVLYNLANQTPLYSSIFHDVATGNDSVVCAAGSPNCGTNDFLTGYNAGPSYDQTSGLGSVDASELISNWSKAVFKPTTIVYTVNGGTGPVHAAHGQKITVQIAVSGNGGTPTGTIGIQDAVDGPDNDNTYGYNAGFTGTLAHGSFAATAADEPGGTYNTWASYSGDLDFAASTTVATPIVLIVTPEPSTLPLTLSNSSGVKQSTVPTPTYPYGTYLSVDAMPRGISGQGLATGTVTFADNGAAVPSTHTNNLNRRGFAEIPDYYWTVGTHSITASYSGDNSFNPSVSTTTLTFNIGQATSTLMVTATPSSLISGAVTVTGTVAATVVNSGAPPSGTVALVDSTNGVSFGEVTLVAGTSQSTFTFTIQASQLALGANLLTATYGGDTNYTGASGTTTVTRLAQGATALTMVANPSSLLTGSATITGQIMPLVSGAAAAPTGLVTLVDSTSGVSFGTVQLIAGTNQSTFTFTIQASQLALGANTLTAMYGGDANYAGASGTTTVTRLGPAATALTMVANPSSLVTGSTTITGQITPLASGVGVSPSGSVTLVDSTNGAQLGTAPLVPGTGQNGLAIATFTLAVNATSLTVGANTITGTYAGDVNYSGSAGNVVVTLLAPPPNPAFTVSATGVTIATPGQTTGNTSTISVVPANGFAGQVNLTAVFVSGPGGAVSPPTLALSALSVSITGTAPVTATATITTTALTYAMQKPANRIPSRWYEGGGMTLAGLLLLGIPARRRGWRSMLGLLLFVGVGLSVGCGVHLNAVKTEATSPGNYVFSVSGVDQATGLLKSSTTITVTVQ